MTAQPLIPGYHSETACSIPLDQADAIVRASAYHRTDFDHAVIWLPPYTHNSFLSAGAFHDSRSAMGNLGGIPLELINEVCLRPDIASN